MNTLPVDGRSTQASATYVRFDPARLDVETGRYAAGGSDDVDRALAAAARAQPGWAATPALDLAARFADRLADVGRRATRGLLDALVEQFRGGAQNFRPLGLPGTRRASYCRPCSRRYAEKAH